MLLAEPPAPPTTRASRRRMDVVAPAAAAYPIVGMASSIAGPSFSPVPEPLKRRRLEACLHVVRIPVTLPPAIVFAILGVLPLPQASVLAVRAPGGAAVEPVRAPASESAGGFSTVLGALIVHAGSDLRRRPTLPFALLAAGNADRQHQGCARAAATSRGGNYGRRPAAVRRMKVVAYAGGYWGMPFEVSVTVTRTSDRDERLRDVKREEGGRRPVALERFLKADRTAEVVAANACVTAPPSRVGLAGGSAWTVDGIMTGAAGTLQRRGRHGRRSSGFRLVAEAIGDGGDTCDMASPPGCCEMVCVRQLPAAWEPIRLKAASDMMNLPPRRPAW